jgi:heme/copper-type cytochrome/quinol oxidase subunit 2
MNEQITNILYSLIPVLIIVAWILVVTFLVWVIVKFVRRQKAKRH